MLTSLARAERRRSSAMPFPRASKALARFTVLDLTRVRAGPTCVRQLADWGANVVKIEAPPGPEEPMGGPREAGDFQNLHRNEARHDAQSEGAGRASLPSSAWSRKLTFWWRISAPA